MKQGQSIINGLGGRIQYDPEGGRSKPFVIFRGGTASNAFTTLQEAKDAFGDCTWSKPF
jgi:hypothetical protein